MTNRIVYLFAIQLIFLYLLFSKRSDADSSPIGKGHSPGIATMVRLAACKTLYLQNYYWYQLLTRIIIYQSGILQYAIVLDAGSTGSRIHVYRFNYCKGIGNPTLEDEVFATTKPGLSSFASDFNGAVESIKVLMKAAVKSVPKEFYHCTPVTLKATAGLRMLKDGLGGKILSKVAASLENDYPFPVYHEEGVSIMGGDQEGVFAWITLNYLLGRIGGSSSTRLSTAGIMDLGGGSTQIVFEEPSVLHGEHRVELEFSGQTYTLYQHSYDGYGLMQARKLIHEESTKEPYDAPCLPKGTEIEVNDKQGDKVTLKGSASDFGQCQNLISNRVFSKDQLWCPKTPCSFDGVYMPPLEDHHELYAFSYFFDKFTQPFEVGESFYLGQLKSAAEDVCGSKPLTNLGIEAQKEFFKNQEWCTDLGYMYSLLSVGYSLPDSRKISSVKKINGIEIGWSLGCAIKMLENSPKCSTP